MSTKSEYKQLVEEAIRHERLYYIEAKPEITDYQFDQLIKKIESIEKAHPDWVLEESPTQKITPDAPIKSKFLQVEHSRPMLSLMNTYSSRELADFVGRMQKFLESKEV